MKFRTTEESLRGIELGTVLFAIDGPSQTPTWDGCARRGVVQERVTDRWGTHLRVLTSDGTETSVHVVHEIGERAGIGWYVER